MWILRALTNFPFRVLCSARIKACKRDFFHSHSIYYIPSRISHDRMLANQVVLIFDRTYEMKGWYNQQKTIKIGVHTSRKCHVYFSFLIEKIWMRKALFELIYVLRSKAYGQKSVCMHVSQFLLPYRNKNIKRTHASIDSHCLVSWLTGWLSVLMYESKYWTRSDVVPFFCIIQAVCVHICTYRIHFTQNG